MDVQLVHDLAPLLGDLLADLSSAFFVAMRPNLARSMRLLLMEMFPERHDLHFDRELRVVLLLVGGGQTLTNRLVQVFAEIPFSLAISSRASMNSIFMVCKTVPFTLLRRCPPACVVWEEASRRADADP